MITTSSVQAGLPTPTGLANDADVGDFKGRPTGQDERCAILRPDTRSFYFKKNALAAFFHQVDSQEVTGFSLAEMFK